MSNFNVDRSIEVLTNTPAILTTLLTGLSDFWIKANEGPATWTPYDVVGHLVHVERTGWVSRLEVVLSEGPGNRFSPVDRTAMFEESKGKSLAQLLNEFKLLRTHNIAVLRSKHLTGNDLSRTAIHPALGTVTLENLLSTWTVHDLTHLAQIIRVTAKQYKTEVGPWIEYLKVLR